MFKDSWLKELAEQVIRSSAELDCKERGAELVHLDMVDLNFKTPQRTEGRHGVFFRFSFDYQIKVLPSDDLYPEEEPETEHFRQSVRLTEEGEVTGISDRIKIEN